MRAADILHFAWRSLSGYGARTLLTVLAMSIGVAAVVVLTSLGEGARGYVANQFASLGTNLLIVFPGKTDTAGASPGVLVGRTPRDLTLDDALSLYRVRGVKRVAPMTIGSAEVSVGALSREVPVLGSTSEALEIRHMAVAAGRFLPEGDPRSTASIAVIGTKIRRELFGPRPALGEWIRIGDRRFRVIGVLAQQGVSLGFDTDDLVIIPVASAQALFNNPSLVRILIEVHSREGMEATRLGVVDMLRERRGEEDVTVVTQDAVLATFDRVLVALTLAVAGIAAISLGVAGILIMNVMLIAVSQRTREIGLLKAVGAAPAQIRTLFFAEAAVLALIGALVGLALGQLGSLAIRTTYPQLPAVAPWWAVAAALGTALLTGIVFSLLPARRASRLDAALALSRR
jgi:putative ABC transport system permease protein